MNDDLTSRKTPGFDCLLLESECVGEKNFSLYIPSPYLDLWEMTNRKSHFPFLYSRSQVGLITKPQLQIRDKDIDKVLRIAIYL